ncbi:hypothetical protein AB6A40_000832 [Gnathostoma spinigerum]|uniref:Uncharacterized protein n=1 Tax=Gnathostoma spinigerum TaxID=75299 RepID=A0ABD6E2V0_9BILA
MDLIDMISSSYAVLLYFLLHNIVGRCSAICPPPLTNITCECEHFDGHILVDCYSVDIEHTIKGLHKLRVDRLRISRSPTPVLKQLPNGSIRSLHLVECKIEEIEENAFKGLADSLEEIVLSDNLLKTMPHFNALRKLRSINLNNNKLTDIDEGALAGIINLQQLRLERNNICALSRNALNETKSRLELLDLSDNCFTQIPAQNIRNSHRLMYLDLSNNKIQQVTNFEFMNLPMLKELRLNDNAISKITSMAFMNVPQLQYLYVRHNHLRTIESERLFQVFQKLEILDLSDNELQKVPTFKELSNIRQIRLDNNIIERIDTLTFSANKKLQLISLKNNRISVISRNSFDSLDELVVLLLANNSIRTLERGMLDGMRNLQQLNLRNNSIGELNSDTFTSVPQLTAIDLAHNKLRTIARGTFLPHKKLFWLDLSYNHIAKMEKDAFVEKIGNILLHGNSLVCDNDIDWLVEYLVLHQVRTFLPHQPDIVCTAPPKFAGVRLKELMIRKTNETLSRAIKGSNQLIGSLSGDANTANLLETFMPSVNRRSDPLSNLPILNAFTDAIPQLRDIPGLGGSSYRQVNEKSEPGEPNKADLNRAIEKFSQPIVRMATGAQPNVEDIAQMMKSIPEMLINVPGLGEIDITKLPPSVIEHVMRGGQIPGVPRELLDRTVKNFMQKMHAAAVAAKNGELTPNTKRYLPSLDRLPKDMMTTVMQGDSLPYLTKAQTNDILEYYTSNLPLPSQVTAVDNMSNDIVENIPLSPQIMKILKILPPGYDLNKIPNEVITAVSRGEMPNLTRLPADLQQHILANSQKFLSAFALGPNITVEDILKNLPKFERPEVSTFSPYDINHVNSDVMAEEEKKEQIRQVQFMTAIILGLVGAVSLAVLSLLCIYMKRKHINLVEMEVDEDALFENSLQLPPPKASSSPKISNSIGNQSSRHVTFTTCPEPSHTSHNNV